MTNCTECENETLLKLADLEMKYNKLKRLYDLIIKCLVVKDELCKALWEENEELIRKLEVYKNAANG